MSHGLDKFPTNHSDTQFIFVYITEAHACDEWPISSSRCSPDGKIINVKQHVTLDDRIKATRNMMSHYDLSHWKVMVSPMDNSFENTYKPWPIGIYYFFNNRLKYCIKPQDSNFDLLGLQRALVTF